MSTGTMVLALLLALLSVGAHACLLPPGGCKKATCDNYKDMIIPPNNGDFKKVSTWQNNAQFAKLAFIRSSFNKLYGPIGPSAFTTETWLGLKKGYDGYTGYPSGGPPKLPSVNYEFYDLGNETVYKDAPGIVHYDLEKVTYQSNTSLTDCCHSCRVTKGCPMYAFVPYGNQNEPTYVSGGRCLFVYTGAETRDGPFDFKDGKQKYSPRTHNLGAPKALSRDDTKAKLWDMSKFPTYYQIFIGGYCNPWTYKNGSALDDPHFTGAHGTRYDFNGELNKAFCLVTDKALHINVVLKGYNGKDGIRSWIKELGILWTDSTAKRHGLQLVARSGSEQSRGEGFLHSASVDEKPMAIPTEAGGSVNAAGMTFTFLGTTKKGIYEIDMFRVKIGSMLDLLLKMRVAHPKLQTPDDAQVHFNLLLKNIKVTDSVHGVLGQTYRDTPQQIMKAVKYSELSKLLGGPIRADGASGAGFLEGVVTDYESSGVLKTDCRVASYEG